MPSASETSSQTSDLLDVPEYVRLLADVVTYFRAFDVTYDSILPSIDSFKHSPNLLSTVKMQ